MVRLDGDNGTSQTVNVHVPAGAQAHVFVDEVGPTDGVVRERRGVEPAPGQGADHELGFHRGRRPRRACVPAPATRWFLAEGATGAFSLFYLLQNPATRPSTATVRFLRPPPLPPIDATYALAAAHPDDAAGQQQAPELASTDVSALDHVDGADPGRAGMYL